MAARLVVPEFVLDTTIPSFLADAGDTSVKASAMLDSQFNADGRRLNQDRASGSSYF